MTPQGTSETRAERLAWLLVPVLALFAVHPLVVHGCSCGHDFAFHLESWWDAAQQMRHGTLYPQWAGTAAWHAGEPRFVFYPPLSWMLGALLTLALPPDAAPVVFTWLALTGAGLAMYRLARCYAAAPAALLASAVYLANPYVLFTAFERTAYGELLAAVWMPLLVLAALRPRVRLTAVAVPLALLWLTNAPAAVIGSYGFALLVALTAAARWRSERSLPGEAREAARSVGLAALGAVGGLCLAGFYLVPAAYEQRWVQVAMATLPNMRVEDSFLFERTADAGHNAVLHTVSWIAVGIVALTAAALLMAWQRRAVVAAGEAEQDSDPVASGESRGASGSGSRGASGREFAGGAIGVLAVVTAVIAFLLTPASLVVWHLLPKLAFVQFPWRLLSLGGVVLGLTVAMALPWTRLSLRGAAVAAIVVTLGMSALAQHLFRQGCEPGDLPAERFALLSTGHGMPPTDEYTPTAADNDSLRTTNPAYWLADDAAAFAPGTQPNPVLAAPDFDAGDLDPAQTVSASAPRALALDLDHPQALVLNLRAYPAWEVTRTGPDSLSLEHPEILPRDDGLLAVDLPAGRSLVEVRWTRTPDHLAGEALSLLGLAGCGFAMLSPLLRNRASRSRKIKV